MESNHSREWPQKVHPITIRRCDLCDSEFTDRRDLGQHIGSAHPNQFTLQELTSMVERNVITRSRDYGVCLFCNVDILHPEGAYLESAIDHQDFLPQDSFQSLITTEIVQRIIESSTEDDSIAQSLVEFVITKARKLFAILAVTGIDILPALKSLQHYDFTDDYLPISRDIDLDNCNINGVDMKCTHPPAFIVFHNSPWDTVTLRMFYNEQWKFLAPVFSHDRRTQKLHPKCILPFIKPPLSREPRKSSFFSDVYQVQIHPSHRGTGFSTNWNNTLLAIKELRPTSEMPDGFGAVNLFDREVLTLQKLADFDHNHLIALRGSFSRGDRHYILFPWANGGNLRELWMKDFRRLNPEFMLGVLQQLTGLMDALCLMHNEQFRHGDLKPENILIFLEDEHDNGIGTLKISDMGQARHHQNRTSFRSQPTQTRIGTMTYEAPEAVVSIDRPRSRLYDVWSMGCIFFEFIVWLLDGRAGLEGLARDTQDATGQATFFSIKPGDQDGSQADLHLAVRRRLENIMRHEAWTVDTSLGDLARVVADQMLVISLPQEGSFDKDSSSLTLQPSPSLPAEPVAELPAPLEASLIFNPTPATSSSLPDAYIRQRADAWTIKKSLERICNRARKDRTYLFPPGIISAEKDDNVDTPNKASQGV
ncbi:kinase-like domain-containing protein [Nemania abortiva]|nr:kinase-like domain-containing protein [Nemania abortiva]